MASREESETTINICLADDVVHIWSNIPKHVRAMRREPRYTQIDGDEASGSFTVPVRDYRPLALKRRASTLTDVQRQALADRLRVSR